MNNDYRATWLPLHVGVKSLKEVPVSDFLQPATPAMTLEGSWNLEKIVSVKTGLLKSVTQGSSLSFSVTGDRFGLNVLRHEYSGNVDILCDGNKILNRDVFGSWHPHTPTILLVEGLGEGRHQVTVTIAGRTAASRGSELIVKSLFIPEADSNEVIKPVLYGRTAAEVMILRPLAESSNYFARQDRNVGDAMSSPVQYFDFLTTCTPRDIFDWHPQNNPSLDKRLEVYYALENQNIIIGGGGLLQTEWFVPAIQFLRYACKNKFVLWGAGHNSPDKSHWRADYDGYDFSISEFSRVGVRDYGTRFPWVPCASCMAPQLLTDLPIKRHIGFFMHSVVRDTIDELRRQVPDAEIMENFADFDTVIQFIKESEILVTNSFHGAYWGTLLKRKVIGLPTASKFFSFKHPIQLRDKTDWQSAIPFATVYDEALEECRDRNIWFANQVYESFS